MQPLKITKKYEKYSEYKDSGVEWLGKIPKDWNKYRIIDVAKVVNGFPFDSEKFSTSNGMQLVRIRDINSRESEILYSGEPVKEAIIYHGETLVGMDGDFNTAIWMGGDALLNQRVCCVRAKNKRVQKNLYYVLPFPLKILNDLTYATTVKHLSSKDIEKILYAAPSVVEQEKIASYLDEKTSIIDQIIERKQKLIELLREKRTAVINYAVTKGLDPKSELVESGVEWIGEIPEGWTMRKIFHLFKTIGSGTTPDDKYLTDSQTGIPWVNTGDLTDAYIELPSKRVRSEALNECSALKLFSKKAVVIAMYGATIGKLGIPQFDFCTNQACCVLEGPDNSVSEKFVYYWLLGNKKYIIEMGVGGGQPNINKDIVKSLKISLPPKKVQNDIVDRLDKKVTNFDVSISSVRASIEVLKEFKSSLISNVVTGKIKI